MVKIQLTVLLEYINDLVSYILLSVYASIIIMAAYLTLISV